MKNEFIAVNLSLFDGEGGDGGNGATTTESGNTPQANGDIKRVVYGKQITEDNTDPTAQPAEKTLEDRKKAFEDLISGEYKDLYTEKTQSMINRRFKESKELESKYNDQNELIDILKQRYAVEDTKALKEAMENDDAYWQEAADEEGLTVEQFKRLKKLERENASLIKEQKQKEGAEKANAQIAKWAKEADDLKQMFPSFDLQAESQNPEFLQLLRSNVPVEHAYKLIHMDEIMANAMTTSAKQMEQKVVANVRAKGARPLENGTVSQSAFTVKDDVSKLTREDRADIIKRVNRGETIIF